MTSRARSINLNDFKVGMKVRYAPQVDRDEKRKVYNNGVVSSIDSRFVYVRFGGGTTNFGVSPEHLFEV